MEERIYVKVLCNECGKEFIRHLDKTYVTKKGKANCGSYCRECNYRRSKERRGRTLEDIKKLSTYEKMGVRLLSQAEIDAVSKEYSTRRLKKKKSSLPYYRS